MSADDNQNKSSDHGQLIEASEFQAPGSKSKTTSTSRSGVDGLNRGVLSTRADAPWWHSQFNLMLCVFGLLGIATLLFVVLTPAPQTSSPSTLISAAGEATINDAPVAAKTTEVDAPFSESQRQQARTDSQEILSELLEAKKLLEQKGVEDWAQDQFNAALGLAEEGDQFYQQQDYKNAISQYKSALSAMENIDELIPTQLSQRVAAGNKAINDGKAELAREEFNAALALDRNYIPALQGLDRVKTLNDVLSLLAEAAQNEQDYSSSDDIVDIQLAKAKYQQALDLDAKAEAAQQGIARSTELETDKNYRVAMSSGFNALFKRRYSSARLGFNQALQFKPGDPTAKSALRQSLASDQRTSLASLLRAAKQFEQREQWASALSNYETVLQRDRNQVPAKVGRIRTQARLDLDNNIKNALADPLTLSRGTARKEAEKILRDAQAINSKGPLLKEQITALDSALNAIDKTIKLALNSDSLTQVSLKKEGAKRVMLGKFNEKKLALKPGRYTLLGTRLGFHDVRTELNVLPGTSGVQNVTISCTDLIAEAG